MIKMIKTCILFLLFSFFAVIGLMAQDQNLRSDLPYREIPSNPDEYTSGTVVARVIDGLGFRYYWATEGLTEKDLRFKPSEDARTTLETLDHIYGLTLTILNATQNRINTPSPDRTTLSFAQKRKETLENIWSVSQILKASQENDMAGYRAIFPRGDSTSEYPFWNMLNGPIADAIYHVGQVVSFRRSSGNPINPNITLFRGKLRK